MKINPALASFIPPQTPEEHAALEDAIKADGRAHDPIIVRIEDDTILDGHNRYEICTRLGLPYDVHTISLRTDEDVRRWMFARQVARRNLSRDQIVALAMLHGIPTEVFAAGSDAAKELLVGEEGAAALANVAAGNRSLLVEVNEWKRAHGMRVRRLPRSANPKVIDDLGKANRRIAELEAKSVSIDARSDFAATKQERDRIKGEYKRALERIAELRATIERVEAAASTPITRVETARLNSGKRPACAVALLSDVHAEERVVRTDAIHNEYDLAIAQHRVSRFFAGVYWLTSHAQRDFTIDSLVLWLGGDLITGDIHEELLETGQVPPMQAALMVRDWIVSGVRGLLASLPGVTLRVPCSYGNHARTTKTMRAATGYGHSLEWLIYQEIAREFAGDPRVQVHSTVDEIQYMDVFDARHGYEHGHRMRYCGGVGGITIPAIKRVMRLQKWIPCDLYHFGHFHTQLDLGEFAFNGSVIGPSAYSLAIGASPEPPRQTFYIFDASRGKTHVSPIWVAEREVSCGT